MPGNLSYSSLVIVWCSHSIKFSATTKLERKTFFSKKINLKLLKTSKNIKMVLAVRKYIPVTLLKIIKPKSHVSKDFKKLKMKHKNY